MIFKPLDVYEPLYFTNDNIRYISCCGGRGAGRSHNTSEYLIYKLTHAKYFRGLIARAVFNDLKNTTWLEFMDRINTTEGINLDEFKINNSEKTIIYLPNGNSITGIGFRKSAGNRKASLKGFANATDVLIEEAQELAESELNQLDDSLRTVKAPIKIIFAYNMPDKSHVLIKRFFDLEAIELTDGNGKKWEGFYKAIPKKTRKDHLLIFSDYRDNYENLDKHTIANYERYFFDNPEHYYSEILGYVSGGSKGVIFKQNINWFTYTELPNIDFYETYGLDFGGSGINPKRKTYEDINIFDEADGSSTTVLLKLLINKSARVCYVRLLLYKAYISPENLSEVCKRYTITKDKDGFLVKKNILADNARADKIRDLLNDGLNIIGAKTKEGGNGKVTTGIDIVKKYKIYFYEQDAPCLEDGNNYRWAFSSTTGEAIGQPLKKYENVWDALRYALVNYDLYNW